MSKKCGNQHMDLWKVPYECNRNKGHHGDHTFTELVIWPSNRKTPQYYWKTKSWFNLERYCGKSLTPTYGRCDKAPGHKGYHKSWYFKMYISWKELTNG